MTTPPVWPQQPSVRPNIETCKYLNVTVETNWRSVSSCLNFFFKMTSIDFPTTKSLLTPQTSFQGLHTNSPSNKRLLSDSISTENYFPWFIPLLKKLFCFSLLGAGVCQWDGQQASYGPDQTQFPAITFIFIMVKTVLWQPYQSCEQLMNVSKM